MTDIVLPPVEQAINSRFQINDVAERFEQQLNEAYKARRDQGIIVKWHFEGRHYKDDSEGGVW